MVTIVQKEDPVLRKIAKPVGPDMFNSPKLAKIINEMKTALAAQTDGVALAAPQIGVSLRIFIISGIVLDMLSPDKDPDKKNPDLVFINPEITKISREREELEEGCLSVRYLYGKVSRAKKAKVRAYAESGKVFEFGASGLLAQIFQHETDHLNGVLFIDTATDLEDIPPQKEK